MTSLGLISTAPDNNRYRLRYYALLLMCAVAAGIFFPLTTRLAGLQDGDGLLTSIISTEKLTWYFWGQDRFLNFIPALASVFQDSDINLRVQLFFRSFFAYLAPFGVLVFFERSPRILIPAVALTNIVLVLALSDYGLFNLYVQHNPFGTALVLIGTALLLHSIRGPWHWLAELSALSICFLAYATNFALLLFTLPFLFFLLILRPLQRQELTSFSIINIFSIGMALIHSRIFGESSTNFSVTPSLAAMFSTSKAIVEHMNATPVIAIFFVAMYCLHNASRQYKKELVAIIMTTFIMVVALANTRWVQINDFNIRYFFTIFMVLAAVTGLLMTIFLKDIIFTSRRLWVFLLLCGSILIGNLNGFDSNYSQLTHPRWRESAEMAATVALHDQAKLIIGDFWDVWPVVYEVHRMRSAEKNRAEPIFGATYRGHPMLNAIVTNILNKGPQIALCLMASATACVNQTRTFLKIPDSIKITVEKQEAIQIKSQIWIKLSLRFD